MNRFTVILLALGILLAHTLAIHQTVDGEFAAPYDLAHCAYRIARNLVRAGTPAWNPGEGAFEAYPSPLWIGLCAVFERLYLAPTLLSQGLGIACGLGTVVVLAQFSPRRMGGLIAPLLLAVSGTVASAGASGTEASLVMLLLTTSFLAFEWRWRRVLPLALSLLILTRPEGLIVTVGLLALELLDRPRGAQGAPGPRLQRTFLLPFLTAFALAFARRQWAGSWLAPFESGLLSIDPDRWRVGWHYLSSFGLCSGVGLLAPLPIAFLAVGKLSAVGRRALLLFLIWCAVVVLSGGDDLPFWNALAPALPLYVLAIQEAITGWTDRRPVLTPAAWTVLTVAAVASLLVSKTPTDLGPLRIQQLHRAWLRPDAVLAEAYGRSLGRVGLTEEIKRVERLRTLGVFLRDHVKDPASIVTLWPGAIGYLSRKRVHDMLGRATPLPSERRLRSWRGTSHIDLVRAFEEGGDYVVPIVGTLREGAAPADFLHRWLRTYDVEGDTDERVVKVLTALWGYELTAVPVAAKSHGEPGELSPTPFLILRNKELGHAPRLELERDGERFEVRIHHEAHQQIADLTVRLRDRAGNTWFMRPTGEFLAGEEVCARTNLLLYETGSRPILAVRGWLPPEVAAVELSAQLHNPGTGSDVPLAAVGAPARLQLR